MDLNISTIYINLRTNEDENETEAKAKRVHD